MNLPLEFFPPGYGETHDNIGAELKDKRHIEPSIQEPADYRIAYVAGFKRAVRFLGRLPPGLADIGPHEIARLHGALFTGLYRSAGLFREPGDFVTFGGRLGADAQSIEPELALLQQQMIGLAANVSMLSNDEKTLLEQLSIIAFYHARLVLIHPFHDGNGRVARLLAQWQEWCLFGLLPPRYAVPRILYERGLQALPSDLGPLLNYFCQRHSERLFFGESLSPPHVIAVTITPQGW